MHTRTRRRSRQNTADDVGTLWSMQRRGHAARCALLTSPGRWEVRVLVDSEPLLAERCVRADEAFSLAAQWKHRMLEQGWRQILPQPAGDAQPDILS